jgi:mannitol 2-dehydrogenase
VTQLDPTTVGSLDPRVQVPQYDRTSVTAGVVHFGVGGFHRAHQAMYLDRVLATGDLAWGVCGVGVMPQDARARDVAVGQDGLYTLVTTAPDGTQTARVVGSIVRYLYAPDDPEAVVEVLADPRTRIVSLTITEGGYGVNDATGAFEPQDELTLADLGSDGPPRSVLGYLTAGLRRRRERGVAPFTVVSCDNIQGNGHVARTALTSFARALDPELADWVADEVAFPSSMVDRITPVPTDEGRALVATEYGVEDAWPIRAEAFEQWVLEDRFPLGRPPLEKVGVQLVDDVEPYELMKLRLLNASHQAMSYLGILAGETSVHEVCRDPLFTRFLLGYMHGEAIPTLRPVPGIDLAAYCDELIARFSSEAIADTLARQVVDASDRIPKFLLPVIADQLAAGRSIDRSALVLAAWSRYLEGRTDADAPITVHDRRLDDLRQAVSAEQAAPGAFLGFRPVFGDLAGHPTLVRAFVQARTDLAAYGARGVLRRLGVTHPARRRRATDMAGTTNLTAGSPA